MWPTERRTQGEPPDGSGMTHSGRVSNQMESRLRILGAIIAVIGVIAVLGGG